MWCCEQGLGAQVGTGSAGRQGLPVIMVVPSSSSPSNWSRLVDRRLILAALSFARETTSFHASNVLTSIAVFEILRAGTTSRVGICTDRHGAGLPGVPLH
jgi:hypothetical protein